MCIDVNEYTPSDSSTWYKRAWRTVEQTTRDIKCRNCNTKRGLQVHHIDGNRENNTADNLMVLCYDCHQLYHTNPVIRRGRNYSR